MFPAIILLCSFCQLHTIAYSKAFADNDILETILSYSDDPLENPSNIDNIKYLTDSLQKPVHIAYEQKPKTSDCKTNDNLQQQLERFDGNLIGLSKRAYEQYMPIMNDEDTEQSSKARRSNGARDARGDNFMRFGRARHDDYLRFGRSPHDDYMRFGRTPHDDYMRFGRSPHDAFMRLGRAQNDDYMRFGRDIGSDFLRFGRARRDSGGLTGTSTRKDENMDEVQKLYLRNSRPENFMRFGRTSNPTSRDLTEDFMRFGRSVNSKNQTKSQ